MELGLACLLARSPWDWDSGGREREAGRSVGAGIEFNPEISMGSHWSPSVFLLLFFKNLHFEVHVSESFLSHNGTIHRLPPFRGSPLPPTLLNQPQTDPRHDPVSEVCSAGLWWEELLLIVSHQSSDDLPFSTSFSQTTFVDLRSPQQLTSATWLGQLVPPVLPAPGSSEQRGRRASERVAFWLQAIWLASRAVC